MDGDVAVKTGTGNHSGVARAPGDVEAELVGGRELAHDLSSLLDRIGVPAEDLVVLSAREQEVGILPTPGQGKNASLVILQGADGRGGESEIPDLNHWCVVVLGGQAELRGDLRMPGHDLSSHAGGGVADLNDRVILAEIPDHTLRGEASRQNVLNLFHVEKNAI